MSEWSWQKQFDLSLFDLEYITSSLVQYLIVLDSFSTQKSADKISSLHVTQQEISPHTSSKISSISFNTYDMRPPRNATGLPPISLIFRWHESNRPDVVVGDAAVGPMMCAGDRNILTRLLKPSIFVNVLEIFFTSLLFWVLVVGVKVFLFSVVHELKFWFCDFVLFL